MLKGINLSKKLVTAFMVVAAIASIIAATGFLGMRNMSEIVTELGDVSMVGMLALYDMNEGFMMAGGLVGEMYDRSATLESRQELYPGIDEEFATLNNGWEEYEAVPKSAAQEEAWDQFVGHFEMWNGQLDTAIVLSQKVDTLLAAGVAESSPEMTTARVELDHHLEGMAEHYGKVDVALESMVEQAMEITNAQTLTGQNAANTSSTTILGVGVVGVIVALLLGVFLSRSIAGSLRRVISSLSVGADETAAASNQIAAASQAVSDGANESASALEETSSALEQFTAQTSANADNAQQASHLSQEARSAADNGNSSMSQLRMAMSEINDSSQEVGKILKTIEEIAFQTNLLALNAAVEAARAGEHGKGFAVVAEEVRNLAQRAASATRDTAVMIDASIEKAQNGSSITDESGKALDEISERVSKVADLLSEISAASHEQTTGIEQISTAVTQVASATQASSQSSEEAATAAEELSAQAVQTKSNVISLLEMVEGAGHGNQPVNELAKAGSRSRVALNSGALAPAPRQQIPLDDNEKALSDF